MDGRWAVVEKVCAHCGKHAQYARAEARFCQFCGAEFPAEEGQSAAEEILRRAERETDYARKRALYRQALEADENCLEAWKQLAFLGRLGEKGGKPDFSRIPAGLPVSAPGIQTGTARGDAALAFAQ